jgi:hypothetical protein
MHESHGLLPADAEARRATAKVRRSDRGSQADGVLGASRSLMAMGG